MTRSPLHRPRALAWLAAFAASALVSAGCSDPSTERTTGEVTVLGPGTPIAEGFVVPDDAVLLAGPMPVVDVRDRDTGWSAHLRPRDPVSMFNDLASQAGELGFELGASSQDPCFAVPDEPSLGEAELDEPLGVLPDGVEPSSISCSGTGFRETDDGVEKLFLHVEQRLHGDPPTSVGTMEVTLLPEGSEPRRIGTGQFDLQPFVPSQVRPSSHEIPMDPPDLSVGDPLDPMAGTEGPTLVAGSRPAAPIDAPICQGGFRAALDVTGDPDDVLAAYIEQIRDAAEQLGRPPELSSTTLFGRRVEHAVATIADDSSTMSATMVVGQGDETTRLLLEQCNG